MPENDNKIVFSVRTPDGRMEQWNQQQYDELSGKLFEKYPEAQVVRTSAFDPQTDDNAPSDMFHVSLPDGRQEEWSRKDFNDLYEPLMAKYPEAQVMKTSDMSTQYWEPKMQEAKQRLDAFNSQHGKFMREYEFNKTLADSLEGEGVEQSGMHEYVASHDAEYQPLSRQREELRKAYYGNPLVARQYKANADAAESLRDDYRSKAEDADTGSERRDWKRAAKLQDDIQKLYNAPNKYVEEVDGSNGFAQFLKDYGTGAGDVLSDKDFWTRGLTEIARNIDLRGIEKKMEDAANASQDGLSEGDIDRLLTPGEKAQLMSFYRLAEAQKERAENISSGYSAGGSFAESLGFMAEFILSTGLANVAGKALSSSSKGLASWLGRELMSERALNRAIEKGVTVATDFSKLSRGAKAAKLADEYLAKPIVQGLWHTGTQVGTLATISDGLMDTDSNGQLISVGKAVLNGVLDSVVENWSESFGGAIEKTLALPFEGVSAIGKRTLGKTGFGRWARWMYNSAPTQLLKEAGFNGMIGEIGEEWAGNAVRVGLGLMTPEDFKSFASWEQQLEMAASFAPMSLFGLGTSSYSAIKHSKNYNRLKGKVQDILQKQEVDQNKIDALFNTRFDTPEDIAKKFAPYLRNISADAQSPTAKEDYKTMLDFAKEVGIKTIVEEMDQMDRAEKRNDMRELISGTAGRFWQEYDSPEAKDADGNPLRIQQVRVVEYADGHPVYIVGGHEGLPGQEEGLFATVDESGKKGFIKQADIDAGLANGTITSDKEMLLDDYLQERVDATNRDTESQRMSEETRQQIAGIRQAVTDNPQFNIGTVESPIPATVVAMNGSGVHVVFNSPENGQGELDLTWKEVGDYLGTPISVKTDAEIEEDAAKARDEAKQRLDDIQKITPGTEITVRLGEGETAEDVKYPFQKATMDDGQIMVYYLDENGESKQVSEDMVVNLPELTELAKADVPAEASEEETEETEPVEKPETPAVAKYTDANGNINRTAFQNNEPAEWAKWNDEQNNDGGADTQQAVNAKIKKLNKEIKGVDKKLADEDNPDTRETLKEQKSGLVQRLNTWQGILDGYVAREEAERQAAEAEAKRKERAEKVRERELNEPKSLQEVVSNWIATIKKGSLNKEDFKRETGLGETELKRFFPYWAKSGQGKTVVGLAESIAADDASGLIPVDGVTGQPDIQAVRDAIIDVMRSASKPSDIKNATREANLQREAEMESAYEEASEEAGSESSAEEDIPLEAFIGYQTGRSEEVDQNGIAFVLSSDGTTTFGEVSAESGLPAAPIKLSEGKVTNNESKEGYGLEHIEARHGDEIRKAGFKNVVEFVEFVARNYDPNNIKIGKKRNDGSSTYLIQVKDQHNNTLFIELSSDGSYWNVNSGGVFSSRYGENKESVKPASAQQDRESVPDNTLRPSVQADNEEGPNGNVSSVSSEGKDNENSGNTSVSEQIEAARQDVDTNPSDAQKEAGNYKKGHVTIDGYNISIENPKGSIRRGTDSKGNDWQVEMQNDYGYIRMTEGVDGDHIDVFLSDNPTEGNVFVIDQVNPETGEFDEHKVMYGFPDAASARAAYLSNYSEGWQGLGVITEVTKDEFKKWIESSHRKTKPFSEYKSVSPISGQNEVTGAAQQEIPSTEAVEKRPEGTDLTEAQKNAIAFVQGKTVEEVEADLKAEKQAAEKEEDTASAEEQTSSEVVPAVESQPERAEVGTEQTVEERASELATAIAEKARQYNELYSAWLRDASMTAEQTGENQRQRRELEYERRQLESELVSLMMSMSAEQRGALRIGASDAMNDALDKVEAKLAETRRISRIASAIQRFQKVIKTKAKALGKLNLYSFTLADENRPAMGGVLHDKGFAVASNTQLLVAAKESYDKTKEGKLIDKAGKEIKQKYPKWRELIPAESKTAKMNFGELRDFLASVKAQREADWEREKAEGHKVDAKKKYVDDTKVLLNIGEDTTIAFKLGLLSSFADTAERFGAKELLYQDARRMVLVKTKKGIAMLMPVMVEFNSEQFDSIEEFARDRAETWNWYSFGENELQKNDAEASKPARQQKTTDEAVAFVTGSTAEDVAAERESEKTSRLQKRVAKWKKMLGNTFEVITNINDVKTESARQEIEKADAAVANGEPRQDNKVSGWFDPSSKKAYIYLPHISDEADLDRSILHEVIAHKGIRALFPTDAEFNKFLDYVYNNVMTAEARAAMLEYVGAETNVPGGIPIESARAAADEFIAHVSERNTSIVKQLDDSVWNRIVEAVKRIIEDMAGQDIWNAEVDVTTPFDGILRESVAEFVKARPAPVKKTETKTKTSSRGSKKIEDFGEKIGGARKDMVRSKVNDTAKLSSSDLKTLGSTDKILSAANVIKSFHKGEMDEKTARIFLALGQVAKRKMYGSTLVLLTKYRDLALAWANGQEVKMEITEHDIDVYASQYNERVTSQPNFRERVKQDLEYILNGSFYHYMHTYELMNFPAVERKLGSYVIRVPREDEKGDKRIFVKSSWDAMRGYVFKTEEEAVSWLDKQCPAIVIKEAPGKREEGEEKAKYGSLDVVKDQYGWYRVKSRLTPGSIFLSKKFSTREAAEKYLEENHVDLEERERQLVSSLLGSNIGSVEREGPDYRGGADVTEDEFQKAFGTRGVEFGNWVPQRERQLYLNKTYDAIMDLAEILGISPKAFTHGGRLALAFGARGKSRALAHYEPMKEVINLTRMSGAGSLAHEWWHSFDNYMSRIPTGSALAFATKTRKTERDEIAEAFKELTIAVQRMDYARRSRNADGGKPYWSMIEEMTARLFESYVYNKFEALGRRSPLLVRKDTLYDEIEDEINKNAWPYPSKEENETIKPYFDRLFAALQEREDEKGNVLLFRRGGTLMGLHNISEDKLTKAIKTGGLANPSAAVIDINTRTHDNFGEISLLMPSSLVDSETGRNAGIFTGDAWSPTYPGTRRIMPEDGNALYQKDLRDLPEGIRSQVALYYSEHLESDRTGAALAWWFLQDTGRTPDVVRIGMEIPAGLREKLSPMLDKGFWEVVEDRKTLDKLIDLFRFYAQDDEVNQAQKHMEPREGAAEFVKRRLAERNAQIDQYGVALSFVESFFNRNKNRLLHFGEVDMNDTFLKARQYVDQNDLGSEFTDWLQDRDDRYSVETKLFDGYDENGDPRLFDNTVENASMLMNNERETNSYDNGGLSATRSALLKRLRTLSDIRKNRASLSRDIDDEEWKRVEDQLFSIISRLADMQQISDNQFTNIDLAETRLQEALASRNPVSYLNAQYGYRIPSKGEFADDLSQFIEDARALPVKFFEVKFQRPVHLNEFAAAVVPSDISEESRKALIDAGLPIYEYGENMSRQDATMSASEIEGIRFSRAFHGSGQLFDAFDHSHMGEGEGAQAHGWGTYVAFNEETAKGYATRSGRTARTGDRLAIRDSIRSLMQQRSDRAEVNLASGKRQREWVKTHPEAPQEDKDRHLELARMLAMNEEPIYQSLDRAIHQRELLVNSMEQGVIYRHADMHTPLEEMEVIADATFMLNNLSIPSRENFLDYYRYEYNNTWEKGSSRSKAYEFVQSTADGDWASDRHLYEVEVPNDNGENYIHESDNAKLTDVAEVWEALWKVAESDTLVYLMMPEFREFNLNHTGKSNEYLYDDVARILGSKKEASKLFESIGYVGILYNGFIDGECAVIFDEKDLKITDHIRFRRSPQRPASFTEEQWEQVRTPEFKGWFGDWEIVKAAKDLRSMSPIEAGGHKFASRAEALEAYRSLKPGQNIKDGAEVEFVMGIFGKMYRGGDNLFTSIIPDLKRLFDNSLHLYDSEDDRAGSMRPDGTTHPERRNVEDYSYYAVKANVEGQDVYVRFTLMNVRNNDAANLHFVKVTDIDIYEIPVGAAFTSPEDTGGRLDTDGKTDANIQTFFENAKKAEENLSKVVDKEGYPMVVYHGTPSKFSVFDESYADEASELGQGFYFTDNRELAETYTKPNGDNQPYIDGLIDEYLTDHPDASFDEAEQQVLKTAFSNARTIPAFLNIRKPFYTDSIERSAEEYNEILSQDHDGIIDEHFNERHGQDFDESTPQTRQYLVKESRQIKSATENTGDFDPDNPDIRFRKRTKPAPTKTGIGYKVFYMKDGKLYPPMVANPGGIDTPVGVWLDAEAAPVAGTSKTGRPQVRAGGKGTQGGSGMLAYRPGWHLGEIPYALQFGRLNPETGKKDLFPKDFVWAEVEYAADVDYQQEAEAEGMTEGGKYRHSYAGLKRLPEDGFYRYRTNPNPETDPWIITGSMKVNRVLKREEVDELVRQAGREPQKVEGDEVRYRRGKALFNDVDSRGLSGIIGEENVFGFYNSLYRGIPEEVRESIIERIADTGLNFHEAMRRHLSDLAFNGIQNDESGLLRLAGTMLQDYIDGDVTVSDRALEYIFWRNGKPSELTDSVDIAIDTYMRSRAEKEESSIRFKKGDLADSLAQAEATTANAAEEAKETLDEKKDKLRGDLLALARAMNAQKEYDKNTVEALANLAKSLMKDQFIDTMNRREIGRLLGIVRTSVGKSPRIVKRNAQVLIDMVIDHLLKREKDGLKKMTSITGVRQNASGVSIQGELDVKGQNIMKAYNKGIKSGSVTVKEGIRQIDTTLLDSMIADKQDELDSSNDAVRKQAEADVIGLELAKMYWEGVERSILEEQVIKDGIKEAKKSFEDGNLSKSALNQTIAAAETDMRKVHIESIIRHRELRAKIQQALNGSADAKMEFRDKEKKRIEHIHHLANSDMEGVPTNEPGSDDAFINGAIPQTLLGPLFTHVQFFKLLGRKNPYGKGYLYEYYVRKWRAAQDAEYVGMQQAMATLDQKVEEIFGEGKKFSDLFAISRSIDHKNRKDDIRNTMKFLDSGVMTEHDLGMGQLLYIYMVNKMSDGEMKLRRMGITEEQVEAIHRQLDERFVRFADWVQEEYLVDLRNRYNEVHERVFGASMAGIDNYFPLRIDMRDINREDDISNESTEIQLPSAITGSIINRTRNNRALDLNHTDALSVLFEHIQEMEHWAAYAEYIKDVNTLTSYRRFHNQLTSMNTVFGTGEKLFKNFRTAMKISAGAYRPKVSDAEKAANSVARSVATAKISLRLYTAMKQTASITAFMPDVTLKNAAKVTLEPIETWKWCMENLPSFAARWGLKNAGDEKLLPNDKEWKFLKEEFVKKLAEIGLTPNRFVDAVTVSLGARAIYLSKYDSYIQEGYSEEVADERAKQDAEISFNETQQSSENAFLSALQKDRTFVHQCLTVFRNSSFGFTRRSVEAVRNLRRMARNGYKEESIAFMTKQLVRDGLTEEQANTAAEKRYDRALWYNLATLATNTFMNTFLWNLSSHIIYLLFGDDDDKKLSYLREDALHALFSGWAEGFALGNVVSDKVGNLVAGESPFKFSPTLSPVMSDIDKLFRTMNSDPVAGINDLVNLAFQAGLGVNPQSITDAVVAVIDACNGDLDTSKEAMFLILRVMQVPQSQLEQLYIDEIGTNAAGARKMSYREISRRYAEYKVMQEAPLTRWAYSDEEMKKRIQSEEKTFKKKVKERKESNKK